MFTSLKEIILSRAKNLKGPPEAVLVTVRDVWAAVEKEINIELTAKPSKYKEGVLTIKCGSTAEANELALRKDYLLSSINSKLKKSLVRKITFSS